MNHQNKLLTSIKADPKLFQSKEINYILGLTTTQIKDLKKEALSQGFIQEAKREFFLTEAGENYLRENPIQSWVNEEFPKRPEINLEYLKLDKAPPTLTKAIRCLARHLIEGEELKENSTEHYLIKELLCSNSTCKGIREEIEEFVLNDKIKLTSLFEKFTSAPYGLTKSIIAILLLDVLTKSQNILAIYEQGQFQLKLNQLMFDRMIYCPQNFALQKTVIEDLPILEDISAIILPCKSKNILDLTKGLIHFIRNLDKYTLSTERLSKSTARFRNAILNAKDPVSLFYRDIPKILDNKILCQCDKSFVKAFEMAIDELQNSYAKLIKELTEFLFNSFNCHPEFISGSNQLSNANKMLKQVQHDSRGELSKRFERVKEYLNDNDLKILANNITNSTATETQWIERIATFINKSRVPKDWSDNDVADFKVKVKDLAFKFQTIEATSGEIGAGEVKLDGAMSEVLAQLLKLNRVQRMTVIRKAVNG